MSAYLGEEQIVLALARAQGVLLRATQQLLKRDKADGIRASRWLSEHDDFYQKVLNEANDMLDDDTKTKAAKLAGDPAI